MESQMRNLSRALLLLGMLSWLSPSVLAGNEKENSQIKESTITTLLEGLKSENAGLKSSCAYMLGKLKVTSAIIPLMRILHNDANEKVRISAVLALYMIGTPLSINAVKQAIRFDESKRVNKLAQYFYYDFLNSTPPNEKDIYVSFAHHQ